MIELKDLQEERLEKTECHEKIAELFWPYFEEDPVVPIDPRVLNANDWKKYADILATPIRKRIEKASQQIKATIARYKVIGWKGGVILLNSGYASLDHDLLEQIATNTARSHRYINLVICITAKAHTNGFDWICNWHFSPKEPRTEVARKLFDSYQEALSDLMTSWGRSGFETPKSYLPLAEPITFEYGGKTFSWDPGIIPHSYKKNSNDK